eukprot:TRINITY_DN2250_c0_g1_i1.p1 TRINITY_DN2250_c0_g1~~TRINITY_DN2250_c0_g1_i1.p1  ORF type:complete len:1243 (-),score=243.30 TRINITY_DN2250_c0_g1_i1:5-3523(-)
MLMPRRGGLGRGGLGRNGNLRLGNRQSIFSGSSKDPLSPRVRKKAVNSLKGIVEEPDAKEGDEDEDAEHAPGADATAAGESEAAAAEIEAQQEADALSDVRSVASESAFSRASSKSSVKSGLSSFTSKTGKSVSTMFKFGTEKLSSELGMLEEVDKPMPVAPWCARCDPIRVVDVLPLMPTDVNTTAAAKGDALRRIEELAKESGNSKLLSKWHGKEATSWARTSVAVSDEDPASPTSPRGSKDPPAEREDRLLALRRKLDNTVCSIEITATDDNGTEDMIDGDARAEDEEKMSSSAESHAECCGHPDDAGDQRSVGFAECAEDDSNLEGEPVSILRPRLRPMDARLMEKPQRSRFSEKPAYEEPQRPEMNSDMDDDDFIDSFQDVADCSLRPVVFRFLTEKQLGVLERWAINHVKTLCIQVAVQAHALAPQKRIKHRMAVTMATVCQLLQKFTKRGMLRMEEMKYLKDKLLTLPYIGKIPEHMLEESLKKVKVLSHVAGATVLKKGDIPSGLHILVQGEMEVSAGSAGLGSLTLNKKLEFPCSVLADDIIVPDTRDFVLRGDKNRGGHRPSVFEAQGADKPRGGHRASVLEAQGADKQRGGHRPSMMEAQEDNTEHGWSRTVTVPMGDDAGTMATTLFLPLELLRTFSDHFRSIEMEELKGTVLSFAAPTMHVTREVCLRNLSHFMLRTLPKNHMIIQAGFQPPLDRARVFIVVEGEVSILVPSRKVNDKSKKANKGKPAFPPNPAGRGCVLGEDALYGEAYSFSAIAKSDNVKVVSISAAAYLEKLLNRSACLERGKSRTKGGGRKLKPSGDDSAAANKRSSALGALGGPMEAEDADDDGSDDDDDEESGEHGGGALSAAGAGKSFNEAKRLMARCRREVRISKDRQDLCISEWRSVRMKDQFSVRKAPVFEERSSRNAAAEGVVDLCYPLEHHIRPDARRKQLAAGVARAAAATTGAASRQVASARQSGDGGGIEANAGSVSVSPFPLASTSRSLGLVSPLQSLSAADSRATTAAPSSVHEQELNRHVERQRLVNRRLEVEHLSHVRYGFHVEDTEKAPRPVGALLGPSPGDTLLMSCGAPYGGGVQSPRRLITVTPTSPSPAAFFVGSGHTPTLPTLNPAQSKRAQTAPAPTGCGSGRGAGASAANDVENFPEVDFAATPEGEAGSEG